MTINGFEQSQRVSSLLMVHQVTKANFVLFAKKIVIAGEGPLSLNLVCFLFGNLLTMIFVFASMKNFELERC